jgi:hypothetical protein
MQRFFAVLGKFFDGYVKAIAFLFYLAILGLLIFSVARSGMTLVNRPLVNAQLSLIIAGSGAAMVGILVLLRKGFTAAATETIRLYTAITGIITMILVTLIMAKR